LLRFIKIRPEIFKQLSCTQSTRTHRQTDRKTETVWIDLHNEDVKRSQ